MRLHSSVVYLAAEHDVSDVMGNLTLSLDNSEYQSNHILHLRGRRLLIIHEHVHQVVLLLHVLLDQHLSDSPVAGLAASTK